MIFLFGTRSAHLKTLRIPGQCGNCKKSDGLELITFQKFAHIFWVPIFPIKKIYSAQCYHCKDYLTETEIKSLYPQTYQENRKKTASPIWSFTGLILVFALVFLISILGYFRSIKQQYMIQNPREGDIYKFLSKDGEYRLLKVSEIHDDTVYIASNRYSTRRVISMRKLIDESDFNFSKEVSPKLRDDLIQMYEVGEIVDIEREEGQESKRY